MFVIATIVATLGYAMLTLLIVRVVFSWISRDVENPIYRITYAVTEPLMAPVRNLLPGGGMGLDFSPMIVSFALLLVGRFVSQL